MATITNLQGSTQIWNSDEIINQNFQNINNSIIEKTGDQSIAWIKTFTDVYIGHDVTNNTEAPNMRRAVKATKVKNENNAGGVEYALYVDADNSIVWNRKRALRGYLKKRLDWAIATYNELFFIEYDTYDGDTTYTTKARFNTTSFRFWEQNRTSAYTSYTPTITASSGAVGSYSFQYGRYKQIGKTVHWYIRVIFTKGTLSGSLATSLPVIPKAWVTMMCSWYIANYGDAIYSATKWAPYIEGESLVFIKTSATARVAASDLWAGSIEAIVQFTYEAS